MGIMRLLMGKVKNGDSLFLALAKGYLKFLEEARDASIFLTWLLFAVTAEFATERGVRIGAVYRLAPLTDEDISDDMRARFELRTPTPRKVRRWRYELASKGIVALIRTPRGHRILIPHTHKFGKKLEPLPLWAVEAVNEALNKRPEGLTKIWHGTDHERSGDCPDPVGGLTMSGQCNEESIEKNKKETKGESGRTVAAVPPRTRFFKPSLQEVVEYMSSRGVPNARAEAEKFCDHHEARGWILSGQHSQMKSWRAAARTWQRNVSRFAGQQVKVDDDEMGWR